MKDPKIEDFYKMGWEARNAFQNETPYFIRSVFLYGSVARGDIIPKLSDLDIMVVLKNDYLKKEEAELLNKISKQISEKYNIPMMLRIRSKKDIIEEYPFPDDFGPLAMLDYTRDAWYIFGEDLTGVFFKRLKIQAKYVENDLKLFFINIRKQLRSMISINSFQKGITNSENVANSSKSINYYLGDLLGQFAKAICLSKGISCLNGKEALDKAYKITKCKLFLDAWAIKESKKNIKLQESIAELEKILNSFIYSEKIVAKEYIKNIKLEKRLSSGILCSNNKKLLILKRNFKNIYWTIPKGGINKNENNSDAAKRELKEETGLIVSKLTDCETSTYHSYFKNNSLLVKTKTKLFWGQTNNKNVTLSEEHSDYKWASPAEYLELNSYPMTHWIVLCFKKGNLSD